MRKPEFEVGSVGSFGSKFKIFFIASKSTKYFLFALFWDINAMLYQSSFSKIIFMFTGGSLVLNLMKSNLDLKNHKMQC